MIDVIDCDLPGRSYGFQDYIPICDYCGAALQPEPDFSEARDAMTRSGWKFMRMADGSWVDMCPDCARVHDINSPENMFSGIGRK